MKKAIKIAVITLLSLIAVVIIAAGILVYVVFTPSRLTPVVQKVAGNYIGCDYNIGSIDLTFFSTFPEFGLKGDNILIVNPVEGAPSDTLLEAKHVVARIDLMKLLKEGDINVHEVALSDVILNPYISADGNTNFDILTLKEDTTEQDTTESFIKSISIDDLIISLNTKCLTLVDERDSIMAAIDKAIITLSAKRGKDNIIKGILKADLPHLYATLKNTEYANDLSLNLRLPYSLRLGMSGLSDIHELGLTTTEASLALNQFDIALNGSATIIPEINVDMHLATGRWHLSELLDLVPSELFTMPKDISADGYARLEAHAFGVYNDSAIPLVDAQLYLDNATGKYASLPYTLNDVNADISAHLDLNDTKQTMATINRLQAKTKQSSVSATGQLSELLDNMLIALDINANLNLPDFAYFVPDDINANGRATAKISAKTRLADLTDMKLEKGKYKGNIVLHNLAVSMDSLLANAATMTLDFNIPNTRQAASNDKRDVERRKKLSLLDADINLTDLNVSMSDGTTAQLGTTALCLQLGDIISKGDIICAQVGLESKQATAHTTLTDSLGNAQQVDATLSQPVINAYAEYDTKDTLKIPTLKCSFSMQQLDATYDTITLHSRTPQGTARISGGRRDKTQPRLALSLNMQELKAQMGTLADIKTDRFAVKAAAQHTNNKENILLEWRPILNFDLNNAIANTSLLEPQIKIPNIKFEYSNKIFTIDTARVELGHSDFSLSGEIKNIGPWLEKKDLLLGTLNFTSDKTDANELLSYISGIGNDEEEEETADTAEKTETTNATQESEPFIVPKGVDFTLNTNIRKAEAFGEHLSNLGGRVYIKDGVLILEEMGFICEAAKLQLTAMYKTPRRNHIFVGFDYHMTDINIEELVNMIPQVDTMLPMLRSFKGAANLHLAAETYVNSQYQIKPSTIRGACSLDAKDLTLLDGETFTKIAKILTFNKKTENKIDSISAEIAVYKKEIDIYPFLITCDKWMAAVGGQHNLDMTFDYHISLLNPFYLGVDVGGSFDDLKIKPAKCRYAKDFKPAFHREVDTRSGDIRKVIRETLQSNVQQ